MSNDLISPDFMIIIKNLEAELKIVKKEVREILDRFIFFEVYNINDYQSALADIAEIIGGL